MTPPAAPNSSGRRLLRAGPLPSPTIETAQQWLLAAIQIWGLLVLTLHLAAYSLPEASAWSVWPYTFLSPWLGWGLALLAGALTIPAVSRRLAQGIYRVWVILPGKQHRSAWFAGVALSSGLLFWLARLRHLAWGDSYLLSVALSYPDLELRVIYNWQAPFTVFLHQRLWQFVADPLLGWPVESVYAAVSIGCGILFVYLLLSLSVRLGHSALAAAVIAGLVLTTGSMQLFFGYVENYTIVSLVLLVTVFLAWRTAHSELQLVWPVLGLSVANAFHPSTVFLWPGMLLLSYLSWKRGRTAVGAALLQTIGPPLLLGGSVLLLMESGGHGLAAFLGVDRPGGGDGIWFVPLFETTTEWQHYTMFSAAHLLDWSNVHLLISPFGIPVLLLTLLTVYHFQLSLFETAAERDYAYFLGLTAGMYILLTWLWNPDYGGRKDWDLFAPSALVYTLLAGYLLVRLWRAGRILSHGGMFMLAVSLLHSGAWIFTNTHNLPRN